MTAARKLVTTFVEARVCFFFSFVFSSAVSAVHNTRAQYEHDDVGTHNIQMYDNNVITNVYSTYTIPLHLPRNVMTIISLLMVNICHTCL